MHPLALLILVTNCAATVHALPAAAGTPAAHFWQEALPGTPLPEAIAGLIQKGIDHSPLVEHQNLSVNNLSRLGHPSFTILYGCGGGCPDKAAVPAGLFFHQEQVRVGGTMTVTFPPEVLPAILPQDVADKAPFANLTDVISTFNITPSSTEAAMAADTLRRCQHHHAAASSPLSHEKTACATSLESTVKTAMDMLGTSRGVSAVASELSSAGLLLQPYLIEAVRLVDGSGHVGCHIMPFPYAVYDCHMAGRQSKAYVISLSAGIRSNETKSSPAVALAAICHLNTSTWSPAFPAFEILHSQPGSPVCHFLPYANLLFVDKNANT